jgi:hypothetical protein
MFNRSDGASQYGPHRVKRVPGSPDSKKLMTDAVLEEMVGQLTALPLEACYPLQIAFYEKLLTCDLLLPVPAGTRVEQGLPIVMLENARGDKGLPLFTTEQNLGLWVEESTDYVILPFPQICCYAMEAQLDYIVINATGPYGCEIPFNDLSYLAEGLLPPPSLLQAVGTPQKPGEVVIEKNTPMRLRKCAGLPESLLDRLSNVFEHHRHLISRVYIFDVAFNDGPMQPALGIRMPDDSEIQWEQELWPTLQAVMQEMLERRTIVNVFLLNQAGSMEHHVSELIEPLYIGKPLAEGA